MPNTKSNLSSKSKTIRFSTKTRCLCEKRTRTTRFSVLTVQGGEERSADGLEASSSTKDAVESPPKSLFEIGSRAWLYMERVKPGLIKKLAHRWHGPFRIKRKVEEFAYELELPDKSGYRFYPVVHVSRLKAVNEFPSRPRTQLTHNMTDESRLDFDEGLLPENSWGPDRFAGEFEVEAILDD
ncbi:hypothetical protein PC128_g18082 [Phytophthora cactorum]|nr:hypothetical protein PC128_g18082 [Phytophthora cactorum]